ncbi:NADPH-dependent F420 reductase [Streptococcus gallolyticus]|uniref:NADPH-dependent F420 reductase n=1 Tax=Streptococcus gallolyticus TaxID=315405 RepID=A0AA94M113_9STRE|nr:NAD(P)-binding domain-containing protein [Streptococcus gallolyticus]AQP41282.1 coenzyme F420-dependent NADP oxidoreductase [Streptococcus gallolyticus subsp. gallolyticus DSM 16831]SQG78563.1 NADPH-dependent F420 reductase [Streptococcus gallolyticus]
MTKVSIFGGKGNMGSAIAEVFKRSGNEVDVIGRDYHGQKLGDIVVLAVKYTDLNALVEAQAEYLAGKIIIDISNPISFTNLSELQVPKGTSVAEIIAKKLPNSQVVKGFNINFSDSLATCQVKGKPASLLFASDSAEAKQTIFTALEKSGAKLVDAGPLSRARELESVGLLLISLAVNQQIGRDGGLVIL